MSHFPWDRFRRVVGVAVVTVAATAATTHAQDPWRLDGRYHINWGGPSSRAGDIQGYGLAMSREFGSRWRFGGAIDRLEYDLETPVHAVGIEPRASDLAVDAFTKVARVSIETHYLLRTGTHWRTFVGAGLGIYEISAGEARGNRADGGTFDLEVETPTTVGLSLTVGSEWRIIRNLAGGISLSAAQTMSKYKVTDTVSGARGTISPFAPLGVSAHLAYLF